jgi:monoamine oxidase
MSRDGVSRFTADTLDTAVVGAGVGGLYTTWRLLACGQPPDGIGVFEASERVGGRLFSVSKPGTPGIAAEFGEMRFLASHALITSIATKFDLATREFPAGGPENILCFATEKALWTACRPCQTPSRPPLNQIRLYGKSSPNAKTFI